MKKEIADLIKAVSNHQATAPVQGSGGRRVSRATANLPLTRMDEVVEWCKAGEADAAYRSDAVRIFRMSFYVVYMYKYSSYNDTK